LEDFGWSTPLLIPKSHFSKKKRKVFIERGFLGF
jgi:hypothetical protein